jgi:holliday junction DNA helicase RuvB
MYPLWTDTGPGFPDQEPPERPDPSSAWTRLEDFRSMMRDTARIMRSPRKPEAQPISPVTTQDRSANQLRPTTFADVVGQEKAKALIGRMVSVAKERGRRLDHMLLVGPSGTGKTTLAHVVAHELGAQVYQLEAPVSMDTLLQLRTVMNDGDILFLDEIHQQAIPDRRGRQSATQPEVLFSIMEDFTVPTAEGVLPFPHITFFGATTDEGSLPDAFINRFPIRPRLERYSEDDMAIIAIANADKLGIAMGPKVARIFARASRGVPREINNMVKNAASLTDGRVTHELALEVIHDLNGLTEDGLTRDMQGMLMFLYKHARRVNGSGEIIYQASVNTIATAIGKSRDTKAVQLRVEPFLIEQGYVQVGHGGRILTDTGILRALELLI